MKMKLINRLALILLVIVISTATRAQSIKQYEKEWKQVDELVKKQLPQSALTEVKKIYQVAKNDKQEAQVIKALVYMHSLQQQTRENNYALSIQETEKELLTATGPSASILSSLLASMYWNFFEQQRWRIYNRTATNNFVKEDINTWAAEDFHKRITGLYKQSVKPAALLQKQSLASYDAIITKGNTRSLRPTLYDLLAHQALSYFQNEERYVNQPAYAFKLTDEKLLSPASQFIELTLPQQDTLSNFYQALKIYQSLLGFHLNDQNPSALIDADINRIRFVYQHLQSEQKDSLYAAALEQVARQYPNNKQALEAGYFLAEHYENLASRYDALKDTTHRYARIKARDLAQSIIAQDEKSVAGIMAYNLLQQIQQKQLTFQVEKVNIPAQPFRLMVQYRNVKTIHFKLVRPSEKMKEQWENYFDKDYWKLLVNASSFRSWQQVLPETNDLQQHGVEVKADGLPMGEYILLASTEKDFDAASTIMAARLFYVSNISFVNKEQQFFILHRETGQPLKGAGLQVWRHQYNYNNGNSSKRKDGAYKADENGLVVIDKKAERDPNNYQVEITYGNDRLYMDDWLFDYNYYPNRREQKEKQVRIYFFTDRSIYRPGQTLYFKGIAAAGINKDKKVEEGFSTVVYLRDANRQLVDSMKITANEFGSFSGTFRIPASGLTGQFTLSTSKDHGSAYVQVEEYKRPVFYVEFEKLKTSFSINDSILLTGMAKAYAGNNITAAQVKYRVVREARFPYPWLWRIWPPRTEPVEIAQGELTTDDMGRFQVPFKAMPDASVKKELQPIFNYRIYVDVTDMNGETRSAEESISVSYQSIQMELTVPERLPIEKLDTLRLQTKNLAGEFVPALVMVRMHSLQAPDRLIRERYWQQPDQFVMSKDEYLRFFPHDEHRDEANINNWPIKELVLEHTDSSSADARFSLPNKKLSPGWYRIEVSTTDDKGNVVKDIRFVEMYSEGLKQIPTLQYLWVLPAATPAEPGKQVSQVIGSAADNVFLVREVEKMGEDETFNRFDFTRLNNKLQQFDYKIREDDRGGFGTSMFFVKHNRVYDFNQNIQVPWTNKELQITYGTFRDKTLPGSKEEWTVQIKGKGKERVAAEMLASAYDASLDQFLPHQWNKPTLWPAYGSSRSWQHRPNFSQVTSIQQWKEVSSKEFKKEYDAFIFGQHQYRLYNLLQGRAAGVEIQDLSAAPMEDKLEEVVVTGYSKTKMNTESAQMDGFAADTTISAQDAEPMPTNDPAIQVRTNFNETAFFYPHLKTDQDGTIQFSFTMPEALTRWKLQALTHNRELAMGLAKEEIVTQKELMIQPNMPRFLREGDHLEFSPKIVNVSDQEITGQVELMLFDATNNQPVDGWFQNLFPKQYFTAGAGESVMVKFPVDVPYIYNKALTWRLVATGTNTSGQAFSDGEENILPVLTNRILITETLPIPMDSAGTAVFSFDKLKQSAGSETIQHHKLTVEYTSNPAWLAVQALPYLMEYPYECAEQHWNRFYANALAMHITKSAPRIRQIFEQWEKLDTAALLSNLQKNQELKSALLEETPWVLQAKSEEEQKKNIAMLFNLTRMGDELQSNLNKLSQMQMSSGAFPWFSGGPDDRYITQYIITGIGHLKKLGAMPEQMESKLMQIVSQAMPYLDKRMKEDHDEITRQNKKTNITPAPVIAAHYLYMRSFFEGFTMRSEYVTAYNFFLEKAKENWTSASIYQQGMIALVMHRKKENAVAGSILRSLREKSIRHSELGMYWKELASPGWFWYQAPIETQSLMIEVFSEAGNDQATVNQLRKWLLKNKQTNHWKTTKATAEAVYALLLQGSDWLATTPEVKISAGNFTINTTNEKTEAGTGYIKKSLEGQQINPSMGQVTVTVSNADQIKNQAPQLSWGAMYWQYFEDIANVTSSATGLQLNKKLFIEKNTERGPVLIPVDETNVKTGDKITVRIELRTDRDMEYVHMKDLRASSLEPVNVLSGYRYQDGLGYYQSTRDAATHFFISYLRKGTYVFEYSLFATHTGAFNNGITTIQCMYAPEFSSHSEGSRLRVE